MRGKVPKHRAGWRAGTACVALACVTAPVTSCNGVADVVGSLFQPQRVKPELLGDGPQAKSDRATHNAPIAFPPGSGTKNDVSVERELPDPGFVAIPPTTRPVREDPDTAAATMAEEAQQRLSRLVRDGAIVEMFVDREIRQGAMLLQRFFVQIGSYRSDEAAKSQLVAAQRKFDLLLSPRDAAVRQVDLGSRGLHYRVLIGPFPSARSADALCSALRQREQSCIVQAVSEGTTATPRESALRPTLSSAAAISTGTWASIPYAPTDTPKRDFGATQLADRSPLYTAPGLPNVLD